MLLGSGSVLAVIVVVVVFVVIKLTSSSPAAPPNPVGGTALPAKVAKQITSVPASTLDAVGTGSALSFNAKSIITINAAPLTSGGKPEMLYMGAEYCPFCAAERWATAVALSRFGTFTPLHGIHSAPSPEVYPNTATLTFYQSRYTSKYLSFTPVELQAVDHSPLQNPTSQQNAMVQRYTNGTIPFINFGGKYALTSVSYDPAVLKDLTWAQIASALHDPKSPVAQGADGAANMVTAVICKLTGNQPAAVCASPTITGVQSKL
jgi:thiol-disulfide isomerase/thioredoxin